MSVQDNLEKLKIDLPEPPAPVGSYTAYIISGKNIFISGQISLEKNGNLIKGKLGADLNLEQGIKAAEVCAINIIAQLKKACNNDLEKVKSCIQLAGYVNSTNSFIDQPKVINGASDLISNVFGKNGTHTRAAVSANSLPLGCAVEIVSIFEMK